MALVTDYNFSGHPLPMAGDVKPFRSPSRSVLRRSSRRESPSPAFSTSPTRPRGQRKTSDVEDNQNEEISILDPRRFTPTLHANLVSEILSLRRELESKNGLVVHLEENLHAAENERSELRNVVERNAKDARSRSSQMEDLEGQVQTALEDMAKQRDDAESGLAEAKRRLDTVQAKAKKQEDEAIRLFEVHERERSAWITQRQKLDHKLEVAETRLKIVLDEITANQALNRERDAENQQPPSVSWDLEKLRKVEEDNEKSQQMRSDSRMSNASNSSRRSRVARASVMSFGGSATVKMLGISLAEELQFDNYYDSGEDDEDEDAVNDAADALSQPRPFSAQSHIQSAKARKILGLTVEADELSDAGSQPEEEVQYVPISEMSQALSPIPESLRSPESILNQETLNIGNGIHVTREFGFEKSLPATPQPANERDERRKSQRYKQEPQSFNDAEAEKALPAVPDSNSYFPPAYTDSATQFTPPTSPSLYSQDTSSGADKDWGHTHSRDPSTQISMLDFKSLESCLMVSEACQTDEEPRKPLMRDASTFIVEEVKPIPRMQTSATQTSDIELPLMSTTKQSLASTGKLDVPIITINPPVSGPGSIRSSVVLPPQTKSAGCQASLAWEAGSRSISVQTEEIRIDQRTIKLPPHLLPSSITSNPPTPEPSSRSHTPEPPKRRAPLPPLREPPPVQSNIPRDRFCLEEEARDEYPGNNDNGPLASNGDPHMKRPVRTGSLFAGFDDSVVEPDKIFSETDYTDDELWNAAPIRKTLSKVKDSWKLVPQTDDSLLDRLESSKVGKQPKPELSLKDRSGEKNLAPKLAKQPDFHKQASVSKASAVPRQRNRSPSEPTPATEAIAAPPFPVPTRLSSRKGPHGTSDGSQSPTPLPGSGYWGVVRNKETGRPPIKRPALRKVRSEAATTKYAKGSQSRDLSPPPGPLSPSIPESPSLLSSVTQDGPRQGSLSPRPSEQLSTQPSLPSTSFDEVGINRTSVVDAIAQTMIGEWMWKYVRRRKSFGIPESPAVEFEQGKGGDNGARHKRWVWLAPYERAVMWSTKQPTTGSALLGKSGRKLSIQSVLDVKDETPMPKSAGAHNPVFGRSILILTPQRALKFTATTAERHYVWLNALSFLAHSTVALQEVQPTPPPVLLPPPLSQRPLSPPGASLHRAPIRDSLRVAKAKVAGARVRPGMQNVYAYTSPPGTMFQIRNNHSDGVSQTHTGIEQVIAYDGVQSGTEQDEAAEPPCVPRLTAQTRKRSTTNPRTTARALPTGSFRSFSSTAAHPPGSHETRYSSLRSATPDSSAVLPATSLGTDAVRSQNGARTLSVTANGTPLSPIASPGLSPAEAQQKRGSIYYGPNKMELPGLGSPAHTTGSAPIRNFFEAVGSGGVGPGMVRMEAFYESDDRKTGGKIGGSLHSSSRANSSARRAYDSHFHAHNSHQSHPHHHQQSQHSHHNQQAHRRQYSRGGGMSSGMRPKRGMGAMTTGSEKEYASAIRGIAAASNGGRSDGERSVGTGNSGVSRRNSYRTKEGRKKDLDYYVGEGAEDERSVAGEGSVATSVPAGLFEDF
ncbi:hypothetical protein MMC25_002579 [Agyrium rufum]|nr:hypothetical protein [Agyrium rufum]